MKMIEYRDTMYQAFEPNAIVEWLKIMTFHVRLFIPKQLVNG
ncbi:Uncharacterised protein [uncultured archaeon]|nr:Uncharacterised protein [uncultured archaeon]